MTTAKHFGKGAKRESKSVRDTHYRLAATPALIDWSKPYVVPDDVPVLNQGTSSACTAFATASYCMTLNQIENGKKEEYSRRYIYSQTNLGYGQGAYIWKAMSIPLKGLASESSIPDGTDELTEMDGSLNYNAILEARADKYAVIPRSNINQLAQIIVDYHGFETGFNGHNDMFDKDGMIIDWSKSDWGHGVKARGYEMRNGIKCIRVRNSWSRAWGSDGDLFMPEDFVNSGMMFDLYVYASLLDLDPTSIMLTAKQVRELQALEGYHDESGVAWWTGKLLSDYLAVRLPDKVKEINNSLNSQ